VRILLVDDEESLRMTLAANLELDGHSVFEAGDGRAAIDFLHKNVVDLVLSDIRMPKLGGIPLLQFVKKNHPDVPVVLMTAYTLEEQVRAAISEGVFTVLKKPLRLGSVVSALTRAAKGPVVLIVDDDGDRRDAILLAEGLCSSGVKATTAFGDEEALHAIRNGFVDVCVVDLTGCREDGSKLLAKLREVDPRLAVILLSSQGAQDMLERMSTSGFYACMTKPVDPRELLLEVAKARGGPSSC
jgi:DNA-binding NtrC family response regulator